LQGRKRPARTPSHTPSRIVPAEPPGPPTPVQTATATPDPPDRFGAWADRLDGLFYAFLRAEASTEAHLQSIVNTVKRHAVRCMIDLAHSDLTRLVHDSADRAAARLKAERSKSTRRR
jgi:hypothetical protein